MKQLVKPLPQLLNESARLHGIPVTALTEPNKISPEHVPALRHFIDNARKEGHTYRAIGAAVGRDHKTIAHHAHAGRPNMATRWIAVCRYLKLNPHTATSNHVINAFKNLDEF